MTKQVIVGVADMNDPTAEVKLSTDFIEHMATQGFKPTGNHFYTGVPLEADPFGPVGFTGPCFKHSNGGGEMLRIQGWVKTKFKDFFEVLDVWLVAEGEQTNVRTLSYYPH